MMHTALATQGSGAPGESAEALCKLVRIAIIKAAGDDAAGMRFEHLRESFVRWRAASSVSHTASVQEAGMFAKVLNAINNELYALAVLNGVFEGSTLDDEDLKAYEEGLDHIHAAKAAAAHDRAADLIERVMRRRAWRAGTST